MMQLIMKIQLILDMKLLLDYLIIKVEIIVNMIEMFKSVRNEEIKIISV